MIYYVWSFLAVTHLYLYLKLCSGFGRGWWGVVYLLWGVVCAVLPLALVRGYLGTVRLIEILFGLVFTWIALVGMACAGFLLMDTGSLAARLLDWLTGTNLKLRFFDPRKCVPVTLLLISTLVLYSYYEAWNVRRVDLVIETPKLPDGIDRLRLVHLTDIHFGGLYTSARFREVMDIVHSASPDILVATGDIVDGDMRFWEEEAKLLAAHGAKYGAYAVTGNHEFYFGLEQAIDFKKRAGFVPLRDAVADVAGIAILGLDGRPSWNRLEPETLPNGLCFPEDKFVLVLKHLPGVIEGSEGKFDLQLSGHTHDGQLWPFSWFARWMYNSKPGLSYKGSSAVYVSNGAGFWGPPLRFLTPPEVTVIDLVQKK